MILCFLMAVLGLYISSYQAILTDLMNELSLSQTFSGLLVSLHFIGSLLSPVLFGKVADKMGKRKAVLLSSGVFLVSVISMALIKNIVGMALSILIGGGSFSVIETLVSSMLCTKAEDSQKMMNLSQMMFCAGCVAGSLVSRRILLAFQDTKFVYAVLSCLALVQFLLSLFIDRTEIVCKPSGKTQSDDRLLGNPAFVLIALIILLYVGVEEGCAFWISGYIETVGESSWLKAFCLGFFWLGMGIGRWVANRKKAVSIFRIICDMTISFVALTAILFGHIKNKILLTLLFELIGYGFAALWPVLFAEAVVLNQGSSVSAGFLMSISALGGGLIPFLMGVVAGDRQHIKTAFIVILLLIAVILILLIFLSFFLPQQKKQKEILSGPKNDSM